MSCNQHKNVGQQDLIRVFTGVRAADFKEDFIIEMSPVTNGFINVAGIQSPGLASAQHRRNGREHRVGGF